MRRTVFAVLALACFLPLTAQAQQAPPPELRRLDYFVGEWAYSSGTTEVFEWFGDFFVHSTEVQQDTSGNVRRTIQWMYGYDPVEEVYTLHGFGSDGSIQAAKGWIHDNTWTWLFDEPVGRKFRATVVEESPTACVMKSARSIEGGNWEESPTEIRITKVR